MKILLKMLLSLAGLRSLRGDEKPHKRRGRKRFVLAAGAVTMLIGASMIGLGLYDYMDSGEASVQQPPPALSHRYDPGSIYDRPVVQLTPTPAPSATPSATASPSPSATPAPQPGNPAPPPPLRDSPYRIVIDKIGVNAGVYTYGLDANNVPEVPLNPWDVAWYDFSAPPGTGSNAVLAGHVTWNGAAVFYHLDALVPGDHVRLIGDNGVELVYRVTDSFLVDPNDPAALSVMHATDKDVITLITCGGTPYYIGGQFGYDYTNRHIVRGELVETNGA